MFADACWGYSQTMTAEVNDCGDLATLRLKENGYHGDGVSLTLNDDQLELIERTIREYRAKKNAPALETTGAGRTG